MEHCLLKAKVNSEVQLKEIVTEQNHETVVQFIFQINDEEKKSSRIGEYLYFILPKTFKNEEPKKSFIDVMGLYDELFKLAKVDKNGELVVLRPQMVTWALMHLIRSGGFPHTFRTVVSAFSEHTDFAKSDVEQKAIQLFHQLIPEETKHFINTADATRCFEYGLYSKFHEAVNNGNCD